MANYGIGVGAFVGGLMQGAAVARQMKQADKDDARREKEEQRRDKELELRLEDRSRSIKRDDQRYAWEQEDRSIRNSEREAMKPIVEAKRNAELSDLKNKEAVDNAIRQGGQEAVSAYEGSRKASIVQATDANGKALPQYTVDGKTVGSIEEANRLHDEKHGSLMDHIMKIAIPKRQQAYAQAGDVQSAAALGKWAEDENVRKGIDSVARLESAFQRGDWDGVNTQFLKVHANNDYMDTSNFDIVTEPIKRDGKTVGLKATIKDKATGNETVTNYDNMEELHGALMSRVNPFAVFEANKAEMERAQAARLEMAKGKAKLTNDIELERQKAIFAIAKDQAGVGGKGAVEALQGRLAGQIKVLADNNAQIGDMPFNRLPPEQQAKAAMDAINAQDQQISGKLGQPAARAAPLLYSR